MSITPRALRDWLLEAPAGAELGYTTETIRDEELMEIARVAYDEGRVALFRRRLNDELWLVARKLSGASKRFIRAAPHLDKPGRPTYKDPRTYVDFHSPSGRGLRMPTIPDGFDGPASRRYLPTVGGQDDEVDLD